MEKAGHMFKNEGLVEKGQAKRQTAGGDNDNYGSNDNSNDNYGSNDNNNNNNNY